MGFGDLGGFDDLLIGGVEGAVGDILTYGAVEEENILADETDGFAQVFKLDVAEVVPVEPEAAFLDIVKTQEQFDERGLTSAR